MHAYMHPFVHMFFSVYATLPMFQLTLSCTHQRWKGHISWRAKDTGCKCSCRDNTLLMSAFWSVASQAYDATHTFLILLFHASVLRQRFQTEMKHNISSMSPIPGTRKSTARVARTLWLWWTSTRAWWNPAWNACKTTSSQGSERQRCGAIRLEELEWSKYHFQVISMLVVVKFNMTANRVTNPSGVVGVVTLMRTIETWARVWASDWMQSASKHIYIYICK